jgi:1-deoxy-D-xylulose-5-phosphate synthase
MGRVGRFLVNAGEAFKGSFKKLVVPGMFFEDMGIRYIGPIDGHSIEAMQTALRAAEGSKGPVLIHAVTRKGRGFPFAEERPDIYHGVGAYDPETGESRSGAASYPKYTEIFSQAIVAEAAANPDIIAITAAMADGTGLSTFRDRFPERFFDVGIAEEHAVTLAAGLALGGKLPVVAIYSTFLQRAFDQMVINVALQRQHVVFCVDRAGLVGEDGPTHHGAFDLAYLRAIPQMRILAPADGNQLIDALHTALELKDGPIALRYPRGSITWELEQREPRVLPLGKAIKVRDGGDVALLAVGRMMRIANDVAQLLVADGIQASVYNMLWVKPLDEEAILEASKARLVVTLEEGTVNGGLGSGVLEILANASPGQRHATQTLVLGLPDEFVAHGDVACLFKDLGLSAAQVAQTIKSTLNGQDAS